MQIDDCVLYFKLNKGYTRIFEAMRKKYLSLGSVGGSITLQSLTDEEKNALSGLLREDYSGKKSITIKIKEFEKAIQRTKFKDFLLIDILKLYFEEELVSNSQQQLLYLENREEKLNHFIEKYANTPGGIWLENAIQIKKDGYNTIVQRFNNDYAGLVTDLNNICIALNNLPVFNKYKIRLPVFAMKITNNPHMFDYESQCGQLFITALASFLKINKPKTNLERSELLYRAGILIDDVSNKVLCSGMIAYDKNGIHMGWKGFNESNESFFATLTNLSKLVKVEALYGRVFVVENPSVFISIRDQFSIDNENINIPMVCGYGQINMATLALLDFLSESNTTIYYSGDYDPEGLMIADKLKVRYKDKLVLWRYEKSDYYNCISGSPVSLQRIRQLENIKSTELKQITDEIISNRLCGYQELLIDDLHKDIRMLIEKF